MEKLENLKSKIQEIKTKAEDYKKQFDAFSQDIVNQFFDDLKHFPNLRSLKLQGYTPSFNDGDPCYHRQYLRAVNDIGEDGEYLGDNEDQDDDSTKSLYDYEYYDELSSILDSLEDMFEAVYGTNWELNITICGDTVVVEEEEYWCGY